MVNELSSASLSSREVFHGTVTGRSPNKLKTALLNSRVVIPLFVLLTLHKVLTVSPHGRFS